MVRPPQKVARTLLTMIRKMTITPAEIAKVFDEVERETVLAFSKQKETFDQRYKRFAEIRTHFKGVIEV